MLNTININFVKLFKINFIISFLLLLVSLFCVFFYKFDLGLEFIGGVEVEIYSDKLINIDNIKLLFKDIKNIKIKYYGSKNNIQIKIKKSYRDKDVVIELLRKSIGESGKFLKIDYVGAELTKSVVKNSIIALLLAVVFMCLYLAIRFHYLFAFAAVFALIHDIVILLGIISYFNIEFNLSVVAALFAVFGYSVNDTIIIFDRIRENIILYKNNCFLDVINISINNTFSRTLSTSFSTLFVVFVILIFGNNSIFGFSFVLFLGLIVGTYSSIYIATFLLYLLFRK